MSEADASHAHAIQPTRFDRSGPSVDRREVRPQLRTALAGADAPTPRRSRAARALPRRARARERPAPHFIEQELRGICGRAYPNSDDNAVEDLHRSLRRTAYPV